jgi:glutathione S-transferase
MAILVYLARKYGGEKWLPIDPQGMAEVMQWLALMENEILLWSRQGASYLQVQATRQSRRGAALGRKGLDVLEQRLAAHQWLALGPCDNRGHCLLPVCRARHPRAR